MLNFQVRCSLKSTTLIPTATTGSRAPIMDADVDPIFFIAKTSDKIEITEVIKANRVMLSSIFDDGSTNDCFNASAFTK